MASAKRAERRAQKRSAEREQKARAAHSPKTDASPGESAEAEQAEGASFVRSFAWLHLAYLLALPGLGLPVLYREGGLPALVFAWLPIVVYVLFMFQGYRLNAKPSRAFLVALAVPGQLGALNLFTDGDVSRFFYESAVVEVGTIVTSLFVAMVVARPSGIGGAAVVALLPLAWIPYAMPLIQSFREWSLVSRGLFITSVGSAFFGMTRSVLAAAMRYNATRKEQTVAVEYGSDGVPDGIDDETVKPMTGKPGEVKRLVFVVLGLIVVGGGLLLLLGPDASLE